MIEEKRRTIFWIRQKTIVTVCFLAYSICQFCLSPPFLRNVIIYEKYLKIFPLIPKLLHSFLAGQGSGRLTKRIYASGWFVQMVIKNVHPIHKIMFKNILRTFEDEIFKYLKTFSFSQKNRMCLLRKSWLINYWRKRRKHELQLTFLAVKIRTRIE